MDIQVGDRITYIYLKNNKEVTAIIACKAEIKDLQNMQKEGSEHQIKILKIERPTYEVIVENKELLTGEEKEFLKSYIKLIESLNNGEVTHISRYNITITVYLRTGLSYDAEVGPRFENMIEDENYPIESLGLE